jgi:oxygen-independent coproporphyrinogen-3 oxidase
MTALRTCEGIDTATLADDYHDYCLAQAKPFLANGLLENDGTWLRLTREGLFVSDMVMMALIRVEE